MNYSKTTKLQVSAMCSLWKYMLLHQIAREIQFFLTYNVHEKTSQKVRTDEFWLHAFKLFVLCICVTTLHSYYMKMHSFSAHQKCISFYWLRIKLQYCVGGVCFQRHCDAVSVAGIARLLGFINWLDNLNWPLQRVFTFWS